MSYGPSGEKAPEVRLGSPRRAALCDLKHGDRGGYALRGRQQFRETTANATAREFVVVGQGGP
jgi:hypothetical protein